MTRVSLDTAVKIRQNTAMKFSKIIAAFFLAALFGNAAAQTNFSFVAAGDMRNYLHAKKADERQFDGCCAAITIAGAGEFMIVPGDADPMASVRAVIDENLGTNYLWYPVMGNHEIEASGNVQWAQEWAAQIPGLVHGGPPGAERTTYSFDFGNSHFIALNEFYDGKSDAVTKADVCEAALTWLEQDLAATQKPLIWIFGHKPIKSFPDMDSGRIRHGEDSLTTNPAHLERFLQLCKKYHVCAYICGHTHGSSVEKVDGVWQTDSGHARGSGDAGAPSTFLKFRVNGEQAFVDVYRADAKGVNYTLKKTVELD